MKEYKLNSQLYLFILHECLLDIITLKKLETFSNKNPRYQSKFYFSFLSIETAQLEDCERCWDTEGCSELTIVTTISCCFLIELQQLKLSAAWPGIKLTEFENIVLITSLYINLYFQFYFHCFCFALNSSLRYNRYFSISVLPYTLHKQCHS